MQKSRPALRWIATAIYAVFIFILSSMAFGGQPVADYIDKLYHAVAYGILAGLCIWSFMTAGFRSRGFVPFLAILIATTYGGLAEIYQSFIPHRNAEVADAIANAIGAAAVAIGYISIKKCRKGSAL